MSASESTRRKRRHEPEEADGEEGVCMASTSRGTGSGRRKVFSQKQAEPSQSGHRLNGTPRPQLFDQKKVFQVFTQYFLHHHFVSDKALTRFIEALRLRSANPDVVDKARLMSETNRNLRQFGFHIRQIEDKFSKNTFFIFVNEIDDAASKQNVLPPNVSKFFFSILNEIIQKFLETDEMEEEPETLRPHIKYEAALAISRQIPDFTMKAARKFISGWVRGFWFRRVKTGNLALGVRTLVEMSTYLETTYGKDAQTRILDSLLLKEQGST